MADLKTYLDVIGGIFGVIAGIYAAVKIVLPWWRTRRDRRALRERFGAELYPAAVIERSTRHYIEPNCQSLDPAGAEEPRLVYGAKQNLFAAVDDALQHPTEYRYIILLADSGMGKTSFLLNYYARHVRQARRQFDLALVPLGIPDADSRIAAIANIRGTVLFLDALDEAMSLMEPKPSGGWYIDPVFDRTQFWILTTDKADSAGVAWVAFFHIGYCNHRRVTYNTFVRVVR